MRLSPSDRAPPPSNSTRFTRNPLADERGKPVGEPAALRRALSGSCAAMQRGFVTVNEATGTDRRQDMGPEYARSAPADRVTP